MVPFRSFLTLALLVGTTATAVASESIHFTNRSTRPADDCYRELFLAVEEERPQSAEFSLFGRCGGELPRASSVLSAQKTPRKFSDGTVATAAFSDDGVALVFFDFTHTRFAPQATPRLIPQYIVAVYEDGNLPDSPYLIPEAQRFGNRVVYDSAVVRQIPADSSLTFEQKASHTWSANVDVPLPDLAKMALDAANRQCGGEAELVSSHAYHRATQGGGVVTYTGRYRCAGN